MAVLDADLEFADGQALTATAYSTNVIDKGAAGGVGKPLYFVFRVGTALTSSGGSATLVVRLRTSATISTNLSGTVIDLYTSRTFTEAQCTANKVLLTVQVPQAMLQYVQAHMTVGTENFTAGNIDAYLTPDPELRSNPVTV